MRYSYSLILLNLSVIVFAGCLSGPKSSEEKILPETGRPVFTDDGKTIDSLVQFYQAQGAEFDNWAEGDLADSTLTVCIINSRVKPSSHIDSSFEQFRGIARQIKNVVLMPEKYQAYYIIFVQRDTVAGLFADSHSGGTIVPAKVL